MCIRDRSDAEAAFTIDASQSSLSGKPAFSVRMPITGDKKAFQLSQGSQSTGWAQFGYNEGGTGKPGFALGTGLSSRDTNVYRDDANVLRTDDQFRADSLVIDGALTLSDESVDLGALAQSAAPKHLSLIHISEPTRPY